MIKIFYRGIIVKEEGKTDVFSLSPNHAWGATTFPCRPFYNFFFSFLFLFLKFLFYFYLTFYSKLYFNTFIFK